MSTAVARANPAPASLPAFMQDLLTFRGRLNRGRYWGQAFLVLGMGFALAMILVAMRFAMPGPGASVAVALVAVALGVAMIVPCYLLAIRRLHDRDMSGHWLWLFCGAPAVLNLVAALADGSLLISVAATMTSVGISIWGFIEMGLLRGTAGPNRFGPDPLATPA